MTKDPSHTGPETGKAPAGLLAISLLSLIGIGLNVYLTSHFFAVHGGTAGFKSVCNLGASMNCDAVAASRYAETVRGIPLSSFGAGWFLGLFILSVMARLPDWRREGKRILLAASVFGMLVSVYYIFVMAVLLKTYCLFCLGVDGASLLVLLSALTLHPDPTSKSPLDTGKWQTALLIGAGCVFVAVVFLSSMNDANFPHDQVVERADSVLSSPVLSVNADDGFPSMGPKNAPITIVEFSDFQCPFCRLGAFTLNTVQNRYPDKVRLVFRNYPLNSSCNPNLDRVAHEYACDAAKAAICALKQGKFEPVYQSFFENQESFAATGDGAPENLAIAAGLNADQLHACQGSPDTATAIARDVEEGSHLGVQSTPTFFVNGHKMEGVAPVAVWIEMIDRLLASSH